MKSVYKDNRAAEDGGGEGEMTKTETEQSSERQPATQAKQATATTAKRSRPLAGFFIAGASLALLFGIAALKGRVKDDNTDRERGLD